MPSSHATSLFYFATALSLAAYGSHDYKSYGAVTALLTFGYSVIVAYARIFLTKVHTIPQVVVGAILGSTFAYFWTAHILSGCNSRTKCGKCVLRGGTRMGRGRVSSTCDTQ